MYQAWVLGPCLPFLTPFVQQKFKEHKLAVAVFAFAPQTNHTRVRSAADPDPPFKGGLRQVDACKWKPFCLTRSLDVHYQRTRRCLSWSHSCPCRLQEPDPSVCPVLTRNAGSWWRPAGTGTLPRGPSSVSWSPACKASWSDSATAAQNRKAAASRTRTENTPDKLTQAR